MDMPRNPFIIIAVVFRSLAVQAELDSGRFIDTNAKDEHVYAGDVPGLGLPFFLALIPNRVNKGAKNDSTAAGSRNHQRQIGYTTR